MRAEVSFKPHLQLISSADAPQFHLVLNTGTALYHLVLELCLDHVPETAQSAANPFEFATPAALTPSLTLLHDTRDCWHVAEDELTLRRESVEHRAGGAHRPPARLLVRSTMKFDAEQYLEGLVKRMVRSIA